MKLKTLRRRLLQGVDTRTSMTLSVKPCDVKLLLVVSNAVFEAAMYCLDSKPPLIDIC